LQIYRQAEKPAQSTGHGGGRKSRRFFLPFRLILLILLGYVAVWMSPVFAMNPAQASQIPVVASIVPLGDFCRKIGGARVEVTVLIPPGASPHVFEPTPPAVAQAMGAKVFAYVGAGLDPWAERLVHAREAKTMIVVEAAAGLPLITGLDSPNAAEVESISASGGAQENKGHDESHAHAQGNPHVWLDPVLAQDICRRLAAAFIQVDPEHRQVFETNLQNYLKKLEELDQEIARRVAAWRLKEFVSFHPSFTYFARRYGLKEVGVIEAAPGREPTPGHIHRIVEAIKKYRVRVVFAEPQLSARMAEVIAREAGVKVLLLDPLGGRPPYGSDYLKMMRANLDVMEQAMQ
jgi:zinc transport system substrate-binding protein